MIEVWEKLDCENVGAVEIEAIETVVAGEYGPAAVDSPMIIARVLADEGAELRHAEIMELFLKRAADRPHDAALRNIVKIDGFQGAISSLKRLENLRLKYERDNDKEGLRLLRETAVREKAALSELANKPGVESIRQQVNAEIAEWFTLWLQNPLVFESWVALRQRSPDFIERFGQDAKPD